MKKVISLLLVAIFVINFVFSTFTLRISSSIDEKIISVGLVWNDISFTYDVGTSSWNPSTHSYEHDKDVADWTDKSGQITAYNYSNLPISIDISFECAATPNGTAVLKFSNPSFVLNESLGSTDCTFISADGVPQSDAVLGKIVVFIDIHTHDWKNGTCVGCGEICESNILVNGTDISEYKIVYSSSLRNGAEDAAKRLAEHIQCVLGKNVEIAIDAESNTEKAIIISDTLPDGSGNLELDTFTSAIQYVNGSVWISATNQYTLDLAIDKFIADTIPTVDGEVIELNYSGAGKVILEADTLGEPIKVMSYNLKNGSPSQERKENTIKDISDYMPDTIGTQETHLKWINALNDSLSNEYELVGEQRYGDEVPRTQNDNEASAILYRKSKFTLIDSGTYWLSETPEVVNTKLEESKYVRIMTYVVLERKSDGVRFVHVNTHLNTTPSINLRQVEIMVSLVNEKIYAKHGRLPTYYTGDFNTDPAATDENGYKYLIATGTENSRDIAEITSDENTIKGGGKIDHCIVTKGDFVVTFFDVGDEKPDADTSNHLPVYVEMYITNKSIMPLISDNESTSIIISDEASRHVLYARDKIQLVVEDLTKKALTEGDNSQFEILIGDTGRAESIALKKTLAADEYAIKTVGKKIVIVASNEAFLYEAAKYFCDNYLKAPYLSVSDGEATLFAKGIDVKRAGDKTSVHYQLSRGTHLSAVGVPVYTIENEKYGPKDSNPRYHGRQGGYFDGENFYQAYINKTTELAIIEKKNVKTGEILYSEEYNIGHANDMAYDPYNNRVMVGDGENIWFFDADTLEYQGATTIDSAHGATRIAYSAERHTYVMGFFHYYNDNFEYMDKSFGRQLSQLNVSNVTGQATDCDDTFIYWLIHRYVDGVYNVFVVVYDWYGTILAIVEVAVPGGYEPENISSIDGKLYIATASPQPDTMLSRVDFILTEQYSQDLISNGESLTKIVLPTDASLPVLYARDKLQLEIEALTGVKLLEDGDAAIEILIGDTGRAESIALKSALGADEYAVKLIGNKIVIVASNEAFLYEAVAVFVKEYLKFPFAAIGEGKLALLTDTISIRRAGDKTSIHYNISLGTHLNAHGTATYTLNNQKYGAADANPRIYRRQGGCFNGEIYYQVFISKNEEIAVIGRQNVITGERIYSEPRYMEHSNDATYNPYTDRLYVGNGTTVWVYDGTTLEFIESLTLSHSTARFSYSPERHKYVAASYRIYDESFNYTGVYLKSQLKTLYGDLDLTSQGTACDDTFIYSLVFETVETGVYNAYLGFFDWYGNTLAFVTVDIPGKFEPESVSIVDGKLYIAACSTQPVATLYEISFD